MEVHSLQDVLTAVRQLQKLGLGDVVSESTRLPASSLFLLVRASAQVLQFTLGESILGGNWRLCAPHATICIVLVPAARLEVKT